MTEIINVADYEDTAFKEIRLKTLMNELVREKQFFDTNDERARALKPGRLAKEYLKYTGQYLRQFELCLKTFDGKTTEEFTDENRTAIIKLYEDHVIEIGKDLKSFASDSINTNKLIILDFTEVEKKIDSSNRDEYGFFLWYGFDVLDKSEELYSSDNEICQKMRIYNCSDTSINRLEGKLRDIGKFACIYEAINFVQNHINLNGKYRFRKLVSNLDELFNDFLVDKSKNEINSKKAEEEINELVKEAFKKYEVLDNPKYLIDKNAYKSALRSKFESKLERKKKKSSENE
ncbi:hypothetical protein [Rhodohalobacter sulfatireducens]|uniref:Uncharacterized protein n=1 Tax=Rhodohalobacter sulfatireducens TaxID=2911366 RepID=A0ABS9KAA5_9BACT|nr:hypothetical protein [Rhodohalobacter sulfatireducens]MCG2587784.1 hypothetical protein [Rhodohalobacter sulfatireducens]